MTITDQPTEDTAADPAVAVPALDEQAPIASPAGAIEIVEALLERHHPSGKLDVPYISESCSWQPGGERAGPKAGVVVAGEFRLPGRTAFWVHGVATYLPSTSRGTDLLASTAAAHVTSAP